MIAEEYVKGKVMAEMRYIILDGRKSPILLEGSQASPARPSDKGSVEVKTLGWL
jgi:hypothetical protein